MGESPDKRRLREVRKQFEDAWNEEAGRKADALHRELRAALRKVDSAHNAALWREVREIVDYPVFTAAPEGVGITSTGAEGPNQLPDVLRAYRRCEAWLVAGAKPEDAPKFDT